MKLGQVTQFDNLYQELAVLPLPVKTAYKLMKLYKPISENIEFYKEKLNNILDKYCEKDEQGNIIQSGEGVKVKEGAMIDCTKELAELDTIEVETPDVKFTIEEFENINITLPQMNFLMEFIEG